jgi:hypothetical protein
MSTQILKGLATSALKAMTAAPPAQLLPARSVLNKTLTDYEKAGLDLEEARGHLARSETDEQSALNNTELSDAECGDRVAVAQRSQGIYSARVKSREAAQAKLLVELKAAANSAQSEHSNLCSDLLSKRQELVRGRIIEAASLVGRFSGELEMLLDHSELIQEVRNLEVNSVAVLYADSAQAITGIARKILAGYEAVAALGRKSV